jgi:hypothetical protein
VKVKKKYARYILVNSDGVFIILDLTIPMMAILIEIIDLLIIGSLN